MFFFINLLVKNFKYFSEKFCYVYQVWSIDSVTKFSTPITQASFIDTDILLLIGNAVERQSRTKKTGRWKNVYQAMFLFASFFFSVWDFLVH